MGKLSEKIIDKLLSARFIMSVAFSFTYCIVIVGCVYIMGKKIISVETGVALIASFALIVREIADDYFKRDDRTKEGKNDVKPN